MAKSKFGQVRPHRDGFIAKYANGRKTKSGNTSYTVRTVKSEAEGWAWLREVEKAMQRSALADNRPTRAQGALSVSGAIENYISSRIGAGRAAGTIEQYRISAKFVAMSGLGRMAANATTPEDVDAHIAWRRQNPYRTVVRKGGKTVAMPAPGKTVSNATTYRDRALLSATFRWLRKRRLVEFNPVEAVAVPDRPETALRPFEPDEISAFLEACHPIHLRPLATLGFYSGQGEDELVGLRWSNVSFQQRALLLVRKKTGKAIAIPLHALAFDALREQRERQVRDGRWCVDGPVFLSRYGRRYAEFPKGAWAGAIKRAGLVGRGLTPHSMRRTFATYFEGQERDLQELLGHADSATTRIYRRWRPDRARASVESLSYGEAAHTQHTQAQKPTGTKGRED